MTDQKASMVDFKYLLVQVHTAPGLHIDLLGGFKLHQGEVVLGVESFRLRKACDLLKLLALAPHHRLPHDQVMEWLWPDGDPKASANSLRQALHVARQVLESFQPVVSIRNTDEVLELVSADALWVDVEAFEATAAQASRTQDISLYQAALELYAGELLPEDRYAEWSIQRREALQQAYRDLLLELAALTEKNGEYKSAIASFQSIISMDPLVEEAHAGLMRCYALSGQRSQALHQYQLLQDTMHKEFAVEPDQGTQDLYQHILDGTYPRESQVQVVPRFSLLPELHKHNLPMQLTSFIGREQEMAQVKELLANHRLVTLTGSGGVGKTRLALKVAESVMESFPNGVCLVELAALSDPEQVPQAVAQALGINIDEADPVLIWLVQYMQKKQALLIIDNCEHLLEACTCLADALLKSCPSLRILVTSREIFSLPGEAPFRVPTLKFPALHSWPALDELGKYDAIHLFVDRAIQVAPDISLNPKNAGAVVRICQLLDGIPLAIELAAARVRMMSVDQIANRLDNIFHLLTGGNPAALPRQQTLRASIDWSYNLLSSQEQQLFQYLSVFAGGWTLEAAEAMWADTPGNILDLLTSLVDKSLVIADAIPDQPRYHLLDTIHQFALEKLKVSGGEAEARDRHLEYFCHLAGLAAPYLHGRGMVEWVDYLELELQNLRSAIEWSLEPLDRSHKVEQGLKIASDMMHFWWVRGYSASSIELIKRLLAKEADERGDRLLEGNRCLLRARALCTLFFLLDFPNEENEALILKSITLLRSLGPSARLELGISLYLYYCNPYDPKPPEAIQECIEIFRQEDEVFYLSECLRGIFFWFMARGELPAAKRYLEDSLYLSQQIEDVDSIAYTILKLSEFALFDGDYVKAEELVRKALDLNLQLKNWCLDAYGRVKLIDISSAQGKYVEASQHVAHYLSIFHDLSWQYGILQELFGEAQNLWSMGDYERARTITLELDKKIEKDPYAWMLGSYLLGRIALTLGETAQAEKLLKQSFTGNYLTSYCFIQPVARLAGFVVLYSKQGKLVETARLAGTIDFRYRSVFLGLTPRDREEYHIALEAARSALGENEFIQAWEAGQDISLEQAIQDILSPD